MWPRGEVRVRVEKESLSGRLASCGYLAWWCGGMKRGTGSFCLVAIGLVVYLQLDLDL